MASDESKLKQKDVSWQRGFDYNNFAVVFCPDGKINLISKDDKGIHYTIHPGNKSGVLDIHKTYERTKKHERIFAIKHEYIPRLLKGIVPPMLSELEGVLRPLRLGWLMHRNIGIFGGLYPAEKDIPKITKCNKHKRLEFSDEAILQNIQAPEYLDDIYDMPEAVFNLVKMRRRRDKWIGIAFKITGPSEDVKLYWIKLKDMRQFIERLEQPFIQAAMKYQLPKEEWPIFL